MEHRRFLAPGEAQHPFATDAWFARIGGHETTQALVGALYDGIERDPVLRPFFGRDLSRERAAQQRFFSEWLGGPAEYTSAAYLPLKHRHDLLPITRELAKRWLGHFTRALELAVADPVARDTIEVHARALALSLVNEGPCPSALRQTPHGACLRYAPASESLELARRGDGARLRELLQRFPDVLASTVHAANLLHTATLFGRLSVVELLLDRSVDVNKPSAIEPLIFVTPLCAARSKRRADIEALLLARGAQEDAFSDAFLGRTEALERALSASPDLAQISDPAVDALQITPLHHAVAGARLPALRLLLSSLVDSKQPLRAGSRALCMAAERQNLELSALLIEHGADTNAVGAGRWVLHPQLAALLTDAGARVDGSGSWIGLSCTGNQGRKDDPAYVAALLRHGASVDDRRASGQDSDGSRATALHYAAKAGFTQTIAVLLANGADPNARDDHGRTPLDWLERAAKSVDRAAVRRLLDGSSRR